MNNPLQLLIHSKTNIFEKFNGFKIHFNLFFSLRWLSPLNGLIYSRDLWGLRQWNVLFLFLYASPSCEKNSYVTDVFRRLKLLEHRKMFTSGVVTSALIHLFNPEWVPVAKTWRDYEKMGPGFVSFFALIFHQLCGHFGYSASLASLTLVCVFREEEEETSVYISTFTALPLIILT